jgi:short subunit dehydrogenase-like uncharacterized protein
MANAEQALPRTFDLIVYGASGFTGRPVAEHLLEAVSKLVVRRGAHRAEPRPPSSRTYRNPR